MAHRCFSTAEAVQQILDTSDGDCNLSSDESDDAAILSFDSIGLRMFVISKQIIFIWQQVCIFSAKTYVANSKCEMFKFKVTE